MREWLLKNSKRLFRYNVYRRMFTPYEQKEMFSDESHFEYTCFNYGFIADIAELGNGDWLIELADVDVNLDDNTYELTGFYVFCRLSDLRLEAWSAEQDLQLRQIKHP